MMRISGSEKIVLEKQKKKKTNESNNTITSSVKKHRFLIIVNVLGSAGPIKYVVNGDDSVAEVIRIALKLYAHHGRLPLLGSDVNKCLLYPSNIAVAALNPREMIGECGGRNFLLCKNPSHQQMTEMRPEMMVQKKSLASCWKALLTISSARGTHAY